MGRKKIFQATYQITFLHKLLAGILLVLGLAALCGFQPYHVTVENLGPENRFSFLQEGEYVAEVAYAGSPAGNAVVFYSNEVTGEENQTGKELARRELAEGSGVVSVPLSLGQGVHGIRVKTDLDTESAFYINRLEIQSVKLQDTDAFFLGFLFLAAAFLTVAAGAFLPHEKYKDAAILAGMGLLASLPLFSDFLVDGNDLSFHLARIEGLYQGLRAGEFPVRINPVQISGYGSLSATMYPQLFLYPFALLRFGRVSLMLCYKLLLFVMNVTTASLTFHGVKKICGSRKVAFAACILYTFSLYRLNNLYFRAALGETLAMAFFPLVVWGIYEVLWGDRKKWYLLMLGVTGVLQSHVLSTQLCIFFLILEVLWFTAAGVKKDFWKRIFSGIKAAAMTLLVNAWFLAPFLFFCGQDLQSFHMENEVPGSAAYFSQMFALFMKPEGPSMLPGATQGEMPLTVGAVLVAGALLFCITVSKRTERTLSDQVGKHCLVYGLLSLFLASWLFPWEQLSRWELFNSLTAPLQFAWRFLGPASLFFCITAALGFVRFAQETEGRKWIYGAVAAVILCTTAYFFDSLSREAVQTADKMELEGGASSDSMYMYREGDSFQALHLDYSLEEAYIRTLHGTEAEYSGYEKKGTGISVHVIPPEKGASGVGEDRLLFPLYYFPGYQARVNGELVEVTGVNTLVSCALPLEEADIEVSYRGLGVFFLADAVTVVTAFGAGAWNIALFARKKRRSRVLQ